MFFIEAWQKRLQAYRTVETYRTYESAVAWVKTQRLIGDRTTYLVRRYYH